MESAALPVEIVTYILSFLPITDKKEAALVNRIWYFAARDSLCQDNIAYNIPVSSTSLSTIASLGRSRVCCISLPNLDSSTISRDVINCNSLFMSGTLLSKPETMPQAQKALAYLQELNLSGLRYLSDLSFNRLVSCMPHLTKLSLARCHITFEFDPYHGSSHYNSSCILSFRNLQCFLKEQASSLQALDLSGTSITAQAMKSLVQIEKLHLQELVLQNCQDLTNEAVSFLCKHQPSLTLLDISSCSELSDQAVLAVSTSLQALQNLRLGKIHRLTDGAFEHFGQLRSLQNLDISECSLVSGNKLVKAFSHPELQPKLVSLSFAFCSLLRDSSVLSLARTLSSSLRVLDLSSCVSLTNISIQAISSHFTHLMVLRMAWCRELTDWGLLGIEEPQQAPDCGREALEQIPKVLTDSDWQESQKKYRASLQALHYLQELDLMACHKLTDMSITKVICFPELRRLSLSLVHEITDSSLVAIARGCRNLEHLSLSHCGNLTDGGFMEAASYLRRLQRLNISGCNQLTYQTLLAIGKECTQLKNLDVSMCSGIRVADIKLFQAQLPLQTCIQSHFAGGADLFLTL
ncbi:leucine-rich repeat-containing protein 29 isoform B [Alligator mississippiensis]|uniref:Leucine-rich repeat-containing protein 29 isoform B n=1 Tax=Alligator mississippiensis TaxID=8496 RepID=A0A151MY50_ALLMI|nr:leucine-rich repeat-containing protein 29 isoform B [Alligator mississippiensis]